VSRSGMRRMVGAIVVSGVFAVTLVAPTSLGEGARALPPAEQGPSACPVRGCEPAPAGFLADLERDLAAKMPGVDAATCRMLARTVFVEARRADIDPLLVLALIEVESAFDAGARSRRGALGLMQLREPTMRAERVRNGLPPADPVDPIANVQSGVRYLRRLLDAFEREDLALMAYNAGPNRILGYLRMGDIPERFNVYPRKVRSELRRLRRRIGTPKATLAEAEPSGPSGASASR